MPEESRTEFIQFCDKFRIVTPVAQFCYAKIFNLWIFAFLLFQYKNQFYIILSDEREYYKCVLLKYRHYIYKVKMRHGNINFSVKNITNGTDIHKIQFMGIWLPVAAGR